MFIVNLLLLSSICHKIFDNLPVHQRLPAEEVYFQVSSASGICDQEIQRLFPYFIGHHRTSSMIFALLGKTVFARQIAVMGNMETERLYYCLSFHDILYTGLMSIRCEELSCLR